MSTSLLVGIDVSSCENKVRFLDSLGTSLLKFTVPNNQSGATKLSQKIAGIMCSHKLDSLVIGLEATSVYGEFTSSNKTPLLIASILTSMF